jgi:tetratricopeptide (TPR) repeat protein
MIYPSSPVQLLIIRKYPQILECVDSPAGKAPAKTFSSKEASMEKRSDGFMKLTAVSIVALMVFIAPVLGQTNATDWFAKGMDLFNQNMYNDSLNAFDKATMLDPQDAQAWNFKGISLAAMGRYNEALSALDKATMINSSYAEAWFNTGVVYDLQKRYVDAIYAYNRATQAKPSYEKAWINKNRDIDTIGLANYLKLAHPAPN